MPLPDLMLVLFAILAIATPFIALYLLVKYKKLRVELDQLREENSRQHTSFQREVADLKRQHATAAHSAPPAVEKPVERPGAPVAASVKAAPVPPSRIDLPAPVRLPPPVSIPHKRRSPSRNRRQSRKRLRRFHRSLRQLFRPARQRKYLPRLPCLRSRNQFCPQHRKPRPKSNR